MVGNIDSGMVLPLRVATLEELESVRRAGRRAAMRAALLVSARRVRRPGRSIDEALRLAELASVAVEALLEVVVWGRAGEERVLRVRLEHS